MVRPLLFPGDDARRGIAYALLLSRYAFSGTS
jgi:hypothetical protein